MAAILDMDNQNYKYFETNPNPLDAGAGMDHHDHLMDIAQLPDPSLQASAFWRTFPHLLAFIFIYIFGGMYFNSDIFYYFPILFFFPSLLFIFICLPQQYIFDTSNIPSFINNLSWGFWFGGISFYSVTITLNFTLPYVLHPSIKSNNNQWIGTSDFYQEQIVMTSIVFTSLCDEVIKCYLCHRSFERFHALGASTSSINTLLLHCMLNACGIAIAKGYLSLALLGGDNNDDIQLTLYPPLIYDYKYASLNYVVKAFVINHSLYPSIMMVIYGLAILPLHTITGALWGIGFIRRFVLEHTVAFGQILMFPWFFHAVVNLIISELFYNVIDDDFTDTAAIYGVTIGVPITVTIIALVVFFALFKRQIDSSISHLHAST